MTADDNMTTGFTFTSRSTMADLKLTLWLKQAYPSPSLLLYDLFGSFIEDQQGLLRAHKKSGKHCSIENLKNEVLIFHRTKLNLVETLKRLRRFALVSLQSLRSDMKCKQWLFSSKSCCFFLLFIYAADYFIVIWTDFLSSYKSLDFIFS